MRRFNVTSRNRSSSADNYIYPYVVTIQCKYSFFPGFVLVNIRHTSEELVRLFHGCEGLKLAFYKMGMGQRFGVVEGGIMHGGWRSLQSKAMSVQMKQSVYGICGYRGDGAWI